MSVNDCKYYIYIKYFSFLKETNMNGGKGSTYRALRCIHNVYK